MCVYSKLLKSYDVKLDERESPQLQIGGQQLEIFVSPSKNDMKEPFRIGKRLSMIVDLYRMQICVA